jgi:hypothetical protein
VFNNEKEKIMRALIVLALLAAMFVTPVAGFAASPWTEETTYGDKMSEKAQFGLLNTLFGWTDIIWEPIRGTKGCASCDNFWKGLGKGAVDALVNEVGGAIHLITFPLMIDVPLPDNGVHFALCCDCNK